MALERAAVSLLGDRQENQDRIDVLIEGETALLVAIDGMGGHADGRQAAELAAAAVAEVFAAEPHPVLDPFGFLHLAIGKAHAAVVQLGADAPVESRARATCALCLVQDGAAYWGHVGDSRIYHLRAGCVLEHSRDHSHIEVLLYAGQISADELAGHPMRNYVECCLGGDAELPRMTISTRKTLLAGDVMLACSDGLWAPVDAEQIAELSETRERLQALLEELAETATNKASPASDNTSAVAVRYDI